MKKVNLLLAALVCGCAAFAGDLYDDMASTPELFKQWKGRTRNTKFLADKGPEGKYAVEVSNESLKTSQIIRFEIPVAKIKGKKVEFSAKIKAENVVAAKEKSFYGIKFLFFAQTASGRKYYHEGNAIRSSRSGSFDWKEFEAEFKVPGDVVAASLQFGIQNATGKVFVSDIDLDLED